jgi:cytochrome c peroxidase
VQPNLRQRAVHLHSLSYDANQAGATFADPDGDPLTFTLRIGHTWDPHGDPNPPAGLRIQGTRVVGNPEELGAAFVIITASDPSGATANNEFVIWVDPNSKPAVASANSDQVVPVGGVVDFEVSRNGTVFSDPDGDPLAFEVSLRGLPQGLTVSGTRVSGVLNSVGLVEVTLTARDAYGGVGADVMLMAAPAPPPGEPTLPAVSYVYEDSKLDLPFFFRSTSEQTQPADNRTSDAGATLGRVLFYDKRLSATNTFACASCHQQSHGFATPDRFSVGALGVPLTRNTMSLANARYSNHEAWFWDMRVRSLRELVLIPLQGAEELGASLPMLEAKLASTTFYPPLFETAFGTPEINSDRIARALAQFVQALISYRTKFDRAFNPMTNDPPTPEVVFTAQEMRGVELFRNGPGGGFCEVCHEARAHDNDWQANNGVDIQPADPGTQTPGLQRNGALGIFRAPSLRNIAVTAPYMHDGRFATLREVIDHYDHGVKDSQHLDFVLRDLTGAPRRLNMTEEDKEALEALLHTLTDDAFLADPKFSDPFAD